jgi:hypothetical protein
MTKYRKKPVIVEAWRVPPRSKKMATTWEKLPEWIQIGNNAYVIPGGKMLINTLEGEMIANDGDYIIKGIKGEIYPCKPDIFLMTYEKVEDNDK